MKKKIAILGSTGSIGKTLIKILSKDKDNFEIKLLSANKNYKELFKQAKIFNVKNLIITDKKNYLIARKINKKNINIFNNYKCFNEIFKKKIDYVMSAIVGLDGLYPTYKIIKHTKKIAIANKETIICAWNLINKELKKNKTLFVPVDSEHYSIWHTLKNNPDRNIDKIYLTASGGSLLNIDKNKYNKLSMKKILNHPNWRMGNKITIDSATMINKVFEVIEAKNIFNVDYKRIEIIIHPKSYIHAIIKFSDGMINIVAHETTMEIPIFNSIYDINDKKLLTKNINLDKLNNLNFMKINKNKFNSVTILDKMPLNNSLFETVLVSSNDSLVRLFLDKKIKFTDIIDRLISILASKKFKKLKKILPRKISDVIKLDNNVRDEIKNLI